jgi:UDP-glucose 4-epimerase
VKILITGAAGFLGSHIGIKLSKLGYDVYGVDNMIGEMITIGVGCQEKKHLNMIVLI